MKCKILINAIALALFATTGVNAQSGNVARLQLEQGSELTLEGTSTIHEYRCKTTQINAFIDVDPAYQTKDLKSITHPITNVRVVIPVKSLTCGNKKLEENMFKALKADENPTITYVLSGYDVLKPTASADSFDASTTGMLTISGTQKPVEIKITATRKDDGVATATGERSLLMTDFGVKPPTLMFGALRVANQITVKFNLKARHQTVAAALNSRTEQ